MTELSPAAQAVLDAMYEVNMDFGDENALLAAAALRSIADHGEMLHDPHEGKVAVVRVESLQAIAAELDGTQPSSEND